MISTELARVTVRAGRRRMDLALPAGSPLVELLPELVRLAGDGLTEDRPGGDDHRGWALCRCDGTPLTPDGSLAAQGVPDGTVLYLVPAGHAWPEPVYDDVAEAVAVAAGDHARAWTPDATRRTTLAITGVALGLGLLALLRAGPGWNWTSGVALAGTAVLLGAAAVASRAFGDGLVAGCLAGYAVPFGFAGGLLLFAGPDPLAGLGAPHLLVASAAALVAATAGALVTGRWPGLFLAAGTAAVLGVCGAVLGYAASGAGAAAAVLTVVALATGSAPMLAVRLGGLVGVAADRARPVDDPPEPGAGSAAAMAGPPVTAAVARADAALTGLLLGGAVAASAAGAIVVPDAGASGYALVALAATAMLLRARAFVAVRHRLPLVVAGVAGYTALAGVALRHPPPALATGLLLVLALGLATVAGRRAGRPPSPYLGRAADLLDTACLLGLPALAAAVLGLYRLVRDLTW